MKEHNNVKLKNKVLLVGSFKKMSHHKFQEKILKFVPAEAAFHRSSYK